MSNFSTTKKLTSALCLSSNLLRLYKVRVKVRIGDRSHNMHEITNVVSYWLYLLVIITNNLISLTMFRSVVNRRPFTSVEHFVVKCASFPEETLGDIIFTMRIISAYFSLS